MSVAHRTFAFWWRVVHVCLLYNSGIPFLIIWIFFLSFLSSFLSFSFLPSFVLSSIEWFIMKKIAHLVMETEKCCKLKGLRTGDLSAASPMPSPRTGDDAGPSSTVRQREREHPFLLFPPRFLSSGLQRFGWGPPTLGGLPSPLSLWIQMPASSGDTFTETLSTTFNQIPGRLVTQSGWQVRWTIAASIQHNSQEFRPWTQTDTGLTFSAIYMLCGLLLAPLTSLCHSFLICKMEMKGDLAVRLTGDCERKLLKTGVSECLTWMVTQSQSAPFLCKYCTDQQDWNSESLSLPASRERAGERRLPLVARASGVRRL